MGRINPYLQIARFDHWFKNVFIIPGAIIALYFDRQFFTPDTFIRLLGILLATGFIASSNYVINGVLDAEHDKKHPVKRHRPVPSGVIYIPLAYGGVDHFSHYWLGDGLFFRTPYIYCGSFFMDNGMRLQYPTHPEQGKTVSGCSV